MKKVSLMLMVVILLVIGVSLRQVNARDDSHLQDIKNWTPFHSEDGATYSYEHKEGSPLIPMMYKFKDAIGYEYFYIKVDLTQEKRDKGQELFKDEKKFKNVKLGYMIEWCRIECKNEMIELIELYCYSDTNEFITVFNVKGVNLNASFLSLSSIPGKPFKLAGSILEPIPFNRDWIQQAKKEAALKDKNVAFKTELKKYGAEALVPINMLEVNPYEFEGHTIAVVVQFKKMLSKNSASFYSGYTDLSDYTQVPDEIIVSGIPSGKHFASGMMSPRMVLVLKGKGAIEGTNAFGARIQAPHFQWVAIISGKQPSVFEEQAEQNRHDALWNLEQYKKMKEQ